MLVVISGLPGTGKSAVAEIVADELGAVHLSIDPIQDALQDAGLSTSWTTGVAAYEAARAAAEQNLLRGWTVVVDAVNATEGARDTWRRGAARSGVRLVFARLTLEDQVEHRRRLKDRVRDLIHIPEPSWAEVQAQAAAFEPWEGECARISAAGSTEHVAAAVLDQLRDG